MDDIQSHARKYEDIIRQKKEELRAKRGGLEIVQAPLQNISVQQHESSERIKNYKSKFYRDLLEEEKELKDQQKKEFMEKKKLVEKASNYAKYVREMYAPTSVEAKENHRNELEIQQDYNPPVLRKRNGTADERASNPKHNLAQAYQVSTSMI